MISIYLYLISIIFVTCEIFEIDNVEQRYEEYAHIRFFNANLFF